MNKNFYETEMSFKGSQDKVIHFIYIYYIHERILSSGNNTLKKFWSRMEEYFTNEII